MWSPTRWLGSIALVFAALGGARGHTGKVVVVKMILNAQGPRFDPSDVVISQGDAIQFVNASGGPHNVAFDAATISAAANGPLAAGSPIN